VLRALLLLAVACSDRKETCSLPEPDATAANVLVVLLDDVGVDQLASYGAPDAAPTPTLDCLCQQGVRFTHAWSAPLCSPGRAALVTGRHADKTGIGDNTESEHELPLSELTLGEVMREGGLQTAWIGKWHLSSHTSPQGPFAPNLQGFEVFRGTLSNLGKEHADRKGDYDRYWRIVEGHEIWTQGYATSVTIDDALEFIEGATGPWGMVLALHAAHEPLHEPPRELLSRPVPRDPTEVEKYRAVLEAADTELGRLLRSMDPEVLAQTTVILTADNGTSKQGTVHARDKRVKATLFEGGIHVPLVIVGPGVTQPGSTHGALVHLVDVLPTVASMVGVSPEAELDGVDLGPLLQDPLLPGPSYVGTAWAPEFGEVAMAVRDRRFKLVQEEGHSQLFDLDSPGGEEQDLLSRSLEPAAEAAWQRLSALAERGPGVPRDGSL
jgi:arylsulfatase A-like enzyme